ncbi:hypothetical protein [Suttonella ornithocola]|uniref:Uncharacterized protein n=1 Tax=Suttonella ornithocola TaxID=279832 RepID=A0A380MVC2_9GAMM|nr:hypothetical protein [Suttonella ornithocola]SUO95347.1 Uncharacterised protein [Suttonella ornithocola]
MSNEIANQLLARVRSEMVRNITMVKKQLTEWLERPESGGINSFCELLAEVSGGLALLEKNNATELSNVIQKSVKVLNDKFHQKKITGAQFSEIGAEIASGLLLLNSYIEKLGNEQPSDERNISEAVVAIDSIISGNGLVHIQAQPNIDRETYQALAAKVTEVIETSRNQIEQYRLNPDKQFNLETLIGHNKNLISLFEVLNLKAPQLLLNQINQMLKEQLSESQWIDIAEAMILVEDALQYTDGLSQERVENYQEAIDAQIHHSRAIEVQIY